MIYECYNDNSMSKLLLELKQICCFCEDQSLYLRLKLTWLICKMKCRNDNRLSSQFCELHSFAVLGVYVSFIQLKGRGEHVNVCSVAQKSARAGLIYALIMNQASSRWSPSCHTHEHTSLIAYATFTPFSLTTSVLGQ